MSLVFRPVRRTAASAPAAVAEREGLTDPAGGACTQVPAAPVHGLRGVVAAPHHLAADAGLRMLRQGGSAVDAAIAANAVLGVVCPDMCGVGGDLFALVWDAGGHRPLALNASGPAGSGRTRAELARAHPDGLPLHGPDTISVPGAPGGWESLHRRFGRLPFGVLFADAIHYARDGFPCPARLAASVGRVRPDIPELYRAGRPPRPGNRLRLPAYARTLETLARQGADALTRGPLADELVAGTGGRITPEDLHAAPRWDQPICQHAFGVDIWAVPPNSQGYLAPLAAAILERCTPPADPDDPRQWHLMIEALKAAAHDRDAVLGDPSEGVPRAFDEVAARARLVGERARPVHDLGQTGDTVYLCAVDEAGQGVSLTQSLYHPWGARVYLPRSGVLTQNRGSAFSLESGHPNAYGGGRRARSTLAPTLLAEGGRLAALVGSMGGDVQPQVILQHVVRHRLGGLNVAETLAYPRFYLNRGLEQSIWTGPEPALGLEDRTPVAVEDDLRRRGHPIRRGAAFSEGAGHAQMIVRTAEGWAGAADARSGAGGVAAW